MATYGGLANRIVRDTSRSDTSITEDAMSHIQAAIRFYESTRFRFNEGKASFTASASTAYYNLPTDFMKPDTVTMIVNNARHSIEPRAFSWIEWMDLGTETADPPSNYTIYNQQMRFYPKPTTDRVTEVFYQKRLSTLSAISDSNGWTTDAEDLIYARASKTMWATRFNDPARAAVYQEYETQALAPLIDRNEGQQSTVSLEPDYI